MCSTTIHEKDIELLSENKAKMSLKGKADSIEKSDKFDELQSLKRANPAAEFGGIDVLS